ncbi:MAG: EamA family transporter [Phycisphaerales bacterium]|nr:EamA family transporter [Phycisphaerae bacterium]NNF41993.1 EamA family transporter [Phycisphaerales bacterium]NNM27222.1 EamA family transporter [Phycisphaerales bacterium]
MSSRGAGALFVLAGAVVLLALAGPLVKWLVTQGGPDGLVAPNAISFCNVLFVGNLCAGLTTLLFFGPRATAAGVIRERGVRRWMLLVISVAFAVAIPTMLFTALETTTVTNLILLGRFESISFAACAAVFFGATLTRSQLAGYTVIALGIGALVLIQGMGALTRGDLLVIAAAGLQGLAACTSKLVLAEMPVRSFVFLRNAASAIVFFIIAIILYGPAHFAHAFGPGLWIVMLVYGLGVVALGQLAWYRSLEQLVPATVAAFAMASPAIAIGFAVVLLGEFPTPGQIAGGVIIAIGIAIAGRGRRQGHPQTGGTEASLGGASALPIEDTTDDHP